MAGGGAIADGTLYAQVFGASDRWGNALSPYWQMRGMALLGGLDFVNPSGPMAEWMAHLPQRVPRPGAPPRPSEFDGACASCSRHPGDWMFTHRCVGAIPHVAPHIVRDTRAALGRWAEDQGVALPRFYRGDVVLYDRCAGDTVLSHDEYGPPAFSFYDAIPMDARRILVVGDASYQRTVPVCRALNASLHAHLRRIRPAASIEYQSGSRFEDFARLTLAPVLIRHPSSFSLWAALANNGTVVSPPLFRGATFALDNWKWSSSPVLYPDVARAAGVTLETAVSWLEAH